MGFFVAQKLISNKCEQTYQYDIKPSIYNSNPPLHAPSFIVYTPKNNCVSCVLLNIVGTSSHAEPFLQKKDIGVMLVSFSCTNY